MDIPDGHAERYDSRHGTGLPASAPLLRDIIDFWMQEFGLDSVSIAAPAKAKELPRSGKGSKGRQQMIPFTQRQGQFLAFIYWYTKLHRQPPAELDMVKFFRVTPPSAHGMVVKLEELGLVTREPGVARSIRVAIPEDEIPKLEDVEGPEW